MSEQTNRYDESRDSARFQLPIRLPENPWGIESEINAILADHADNFSLLLPLIPEYVNEIEEPYNR